MGLFSKKTDSTASAASTAGATLPDGTRLTIKQQINCLGDSCPRPQLMTKKALTGAASGEVFEVMIDNPTSMEAIPPMMKDLASTHVATVRADRHWRVFVRKD